MGKSRPSRHHFTLALMALAIVAATTIVARFVYESIVVQRNTAQLTELSGQLLGRAELAIDYAVITLGGLMAEGALNCSETAIQSARQQVLLRGSIKAIEVVDSRRGRSCSTMDVEDSRFFGSEAIGSLAARNPSISIEKPMIEHDGLVRIVWQRDEGLFMTAMVNLDTLMFDVFPGALRESSHAAILLGPETILARFNDPVDATDPAAFRLFERASARYPISSSLQVARHEIQTWNRGSFLYSTAAGLLLGTIFAFLVVKLAYRRRGPVEELASAIAAGEIVPYIQPIFDLASKEVVGGEVLARWVRQDGTVISPDHFIPLAESAGLVNEMTFALMSQAFGRLGDIL